MCQIAVNFRFFMPFNFGWKAYFSARGRGVGLSAHLLTKVPAFLKTGELAASNLHFKPISGKKACCGRGKQELKWGRK